MPLRITTWNVNGIRNPFGYQPWRDSRTFDAMFDVLEADIVIMQELKIQRKDLKDDMVLVPGWDCYFSLPKHKKGYSGVAIYTRQASCAPIRAEEGILGVLSPPGKSTPYRELPDDQHIGGYPSPSQVAELGVDAASLDAEGRCVVLEFPAFVLFGVYSPANSSGTRDDYRHAFLSALDTRIRNLDKLGKRIILAGDLNVARNESDTAGAEDDKRRLGMTHEEYISSPNRRIFNQLLEGGEVVGPRDEYRERPILWDIVRGFHPHRQRMYTHWEQKINARPGNYGSRIDYILSSIAMKDWFEEANIQEGLMGSDHCPVYAVLKDRVIIEGQPVHLSEVVNPPGVFDGQQRLRPIDIRDHPVFSAKLLPEFDKRRSIKDMLSRKQSALSHESTGMNSNKPETSEISPAATASERASSIRLRTSDDVAQPPSQPNSSAQSKREHSSLDTPPKSKRAKLSSTGDKPQRQPTLNSFFLPKVATNKASPLSNQNITLVEQGKPVERNPESRIEASEEDCKVNGNVSTPSTSSEDGNNCRSSAIACQPEVMIDPVASADQWRTLFAKRTAPRCEHNEPCQKLQTKIKGMNSGRYFWICARPVGPSGTKERNTQWRCPTFIWASEWNGNAANT